MAKRKISRKKLKQPDEFLSTAEKLIHYVQENPNKTAAMVGAVLLIIVMAFGAKFYMNYRTEKILAMEAEAGMLYQEAREDPSKIPEALEKLEEVYQKYPRHFSGQTSLYNAANLYYSQGEYQKAYDNYLLLKEKHSKNELIYPLALQSMAYCSEQLENYQEAKAKFEELLSMEIELSRAQLYMDLGRIYETLGDLERARASYQEVLDSYPDSNWSEMAESRLSLTAEEGK
jgi:tetratricopeptide (TPR) repeat protein